MSETPSSLVTKVWNYAHVLREQGISYGDYLEQITYLLFLKMDEERTAQLGQPSILPKGYQWEDMVKLDGDALEAHYRKTLEKLAAEKGIIGTIFRKSQNKLSDPAKLKRVVSMIAGETWMGIKVDVKGAIYEGLLEKNASEVKSGAGQYFTPRAVIQAMVELVAPKIGETVHDPACGTGGFLLEAYEQMRDQTADKTKIKKLREETFSGTDIVPDVVRLCAMNLYLHGLGDGNSPIEEADALLSDSGTRFDVILTNPPFGKKSSYRYVDEEGDIQTESEEYSREDFRYSTSNKQLNFLQHIMTVMKLTGRAGVVLPDNVLFETGQAGEGIRKRLLQQFDFHTLLRLPTGIFYKPGVKANVLFFDRKPAAQKPWTKELWIYDLRTNLHFTLKKNPLQRADLDDFVNCYAAKDRSQRKETERFKKFTYEELIARDHTDLNIFWIPDESLEDLDNLPSPDIIAQEIVDNLAAALEQFRGVAEELGGEPIEEAE
ncbi:MAG: DNA methyltransferase [Candidatus Lambdaproteobacteria bacterium RIFOXYD1_FULL_56_27]|uniref:site-specific DNA-methyltransferase (adenine-specific) n=1 Tax=Candidatus Lambdaproteobacteria bacterium RIFOXYD2_FULL_56_26 TaxID=1817773 RepID=A0A1F6H0N0_9PROT|nr:MAG: DNA methyltransferase [Candidatus Lambdaproteobacteria bacterium RIFOXYC1_FULL_56_13]OGH03899.1 MAG: DNA methyltransferase [Candidatus Lambdaproteobacteria bacterium RIFOXYD2_FULL_56_26]OGH08105.1 MAG: DNA methyltransferase [Candidatus Lambdaproteobacteria bacterium RIFOXYD1_FULL_56_27]